MKYHDAVRKYFNKRIANLDHILHLEAAFYKPETFHKLRVEIKKINAVFELINFCEKNFKRKKTFKPFKDLFKKAAAVRDLQMELALLRKYKIAFSNHSYAKELKDSLEQAKEKLHKTINEKQLQYVNECSEEAYHAVSQLNDKDVNQYFKKTAGVINSLLSQKLKPEHLHELRKKLKTFYYSLKSCRVNQKSFPFDKINLLQEHLGQWHDCRVAVQHISISTGRKRMNPHEIKKLYNLKSKLVLKSAALTRKINARDTKFSILSEKNFQER